ncbi:hypothetical protein BO70DRAFT_370903 [Aspergillus heteromorphus CBS 117.55]|uniref:Calcineurin-like phosphoesterase domain-containing protein n=1 Tax=Aspergillus heteromorphus CBS 117.55 TaxID=1448321 RepID=A0A317WF91_9EURO|nr:uncharacterized protein BO70DRAFT_370903 [Aspergillus heteromorphus CBS 117.55]PWY82910.1 hypothetical protein BO70DRAFT_370903 [Aspergillus heteromorphus CBS 117.55]
MTKPSQVRCTDRYSPTLLSYSPTHLPPTLLLLTPNYLLLYLPLPATNILLHAGDLTKVGHKHEHLSLLSTLQSAAAELKLVIPGNHDITLDAPYYTSKGHLRHRHRTDHTAPSVHANTAHNISAGKHEEGAIEDPDDIKRLYTSAEAWEAGIRYLEEGVHVFRLTSGVRFTVYASPFTPEFCDWAFAYERGVDRERDSPPQNPIPSHPSIDIILTHGPPYGILDQVVPSHASVGCEHLYRAVKRARPRLHVFGHIHEGYGARRVEWSTGNESMIQCDEQTTLQEGCARVDLSKDGGAGLRFGDETLFVNASIMTVQYHPVNAPWVVELDLPVGEE